MNYDFSKLGALFGLVVAIVLIIKKVQPALSRRQRFSTM